MQASQLREKSEKDLLKLLDDAQKDLEKAVSENLQGKLKDTSKPRQVRKQIARIKTILKQAAAENLESEK